MSELSKPFNIPSHKVDETINELGKMPFGSLIGNILSACVDAQNDAANTAWMYTQEVLKEKDPVVFTFQEAGQMKKLSVPLITIVPLPYLKLDNIDIDFDAEVSVNNDWSNDFLVKVNNNTTEANSVQLVKGTSNMHIGINAGTTDMPAGLAMLMNYMGGGLVVEDVPKGGLGSTNTGERTDDLSPNRPSRPVTRPHTSQFHTQRTSQSTSQKGSGYANFNGLMDNLQNNTQTLAEKEQQRRLEEQRRREEEMRREDEERRRREEEERRQEEERMRMQEEQAQREEEERRRREQEEWQMRQDEERRRQDEEEQRRMQEGTAPMPQGVYFNDGNNSFDNPANYVGTPLKALHVNWTRPSTMVPGNDYQIADLDILTTILSALLWRKFNGPIKLYTDTIGLSYYERLGMTDLWNGGIDTATLENIPESVPADIFWAAGKIYAIANESVPFVMMDTDLLVWQSLSQFIGQNPVMAFHPETLNDYNSCYLPYDQLKKPAGYRLDSRWDWTQNPVNTALTYFADTMEANDFKGYYTTNAIKFMRNNTERPGEMVSQMVFAEQRLFAMCGKMHFGGVPTFLARADEQGKPFTHIWGNKATARDNANVNRQLCAKLCAIIHTHFSDSYFPPQVREILERFKV